MSTMPAALLPPQPKSFPGGSTIFFTHNDRLLSKHAMHKKLPEELSAMAVSRKARLRISITVCRSSATCGLRRNVDFHDLSNAN